MGRPWNFDSSEFSTIWGLRTSNTPTPPHQRWVTGVVEGTESQYYPSIHLSIDLSSVADLTRTACGSACAVVLASMFCLVQWICKWRASGLQHAPKVHRKWSEWRPDSGPTGLGQAPDRAENPDHGPGQLQGAPSSLFEALRA